jgi:putative nucleotidyltransferase with HDIG domain
MNSITVIGDGRSDPKQLRSRLAGVLEITFTSLDHVTRAEPGPSIVFDIDLDNEAPIPRLKEWLKRKPPHGKAIFLADKNSHLQQTRARAIGATDILSRPLDKRELLNKILGDIGALSSDPANAAIRGAPTVSAAVDTLQSIFSSACAGEPLNSSTVASASSLVVGHVETQGLKAWIDTVRTHHSSTYQHCLLVTGLAVAFGQVIGASRSDRQRLSFAGMLHDIGKARIPLAILEKPGKLDEAERAAMRKHPEFGIAALATVPGLPPEMLDMVVHHHEYLDGSGYPHGLSASEISDLVRMITISDVFGALIERRSYKPPMTGQAAYQILMDMGPKLDQDLVRAFRPVGELCVAKSMA